MNRTNPYTALVERVKEWVRRVQNPQVITMLTYERAGKADTSYCLVRLHERVRAAEQLGYEVRVRAFEDGSLKVEYVSRLPSPPYAVMP